MMYNPISTEFFDQLTVAMQRKTPSRIEYYQNEEQEKIRLSWVVTFNGKRHRED